MIQWDLTTNDFLGGTKFYLGGAKDPKHPLVAPMVDIHGIFTECLY